MSSPKKPFNTKKPSQKEVNKFVDAAEEGKIEIIKEYLGKYGAAIVDQHADEPDGRDGGWTVLERATIQGYTDIMTLLLESGADINQGPVTPLMWAATAGEKGVVQLLLEKGADMDKTDENGQTALMLVTKKSKQKQFNKDYRARMKADMALLTQWQERKKEENLQRECSIEADCMRGLIKAIPVPPIIKLPNPR